MAPALTSDVGVLNTQGERQSTKEFWGVAMLALVGVGYPCCVYPSWNLQFCAYFCKIFFNKIHAGNIKTPMLEIYFRPYGFTCSCSCGDLCYLDGQQFPFAIGPLMHNYIVSSCYFLSYFLITLNGSSLLGTQTDDTLLHRINSTRWMPRGRSACSDYHMCVGPWSTLNPHRHLVGKHIDGPVVLLLMDIPKAWCGYLHFVAVTTPKCSEY